MQAANLLLMHLLLHRRCLCYFREKKILPKKLSTQADDGCQRSKSRKFFNELSRFFSMLTMVAEIFKGSRGLNCTMPTSIGKRFSHWLEGCEGETLSLFVRWLDKTDTQMYNGHSLYWLKGRWIQLSDLLLSLLNCKAVFIETLDVLECTLLLRPQ